jgi:hypothetical protein
VREALLQKQERLIAALKVLAARVPREMLTAAAAKFAELERRLRLKATSIEELDAQRRFIQELPAKMAPLAAEVEAAKVGLFATGAAPFHHLLLLLRGGGGASASSALGNGLFVLACCGARAHLAAAAAAAAAVKFPSASPAMV